MWVVHNQLQACKSLHQPPERKERVESVPCTGFRSWTDTSEVSVPCIRINEGGSRRSKYAGKEPCKGARGSREYRVRDVSEDTARTIFHRTDTMFPGREGGPYEDIWDPCTSRIRKLDDEYKPMEGIWEEAEVAM